MHASIEDVPHDVDDIVTPKAIRRQEGPWQVVHRIDEGEAVSPDVLDMWHRLRQSMLSDGLISSAVIDDDVEHRYIVKIARDDYDGKDETDWYLAVHHGELEPTTVIRPQTAARQPYPPFSVVRAADYLTAYAGLTMSVLYHVSDVSTCDDWHAARGLMDQAGHLTAYGPEGPWPWRYLCLVKDEQGPPCVPQWLSIGKTIVAFTHDEIELI